MTLQEMGVIFVYLTQQVSAFLTSTCGTFSIRMLVPVALILLSSVVNFGTACCEKQVRISTLLDSAMDLISKIKSENFSCPEEHNCTTCRPQDCSDLYRRGYNKSGVYAIWPVNRLTLTRSLDVYCDMTDGGWTVIQRRGDFGRPDDYFDRNWESYKKGFGELEKDFWLGNDNIFALTNQKPYSVYFALEDKQKNKAYARYDNFWIDNEYNSYILHISGFNGTAGDAMSSHNNKKFTTKEQGNERWPYENCSIKYKSGWWFNNCYGANLNGLYNNETHGIIWYQWGDKHEYIPQTEIKIKSSIF